MWGINTEIYLEDLQMYIHYRYKRFEELFHVSDQFEYLKIFDNNIKINGEYANCDSRKAFIIVLLSFKPTYVQSLANV